MTVPMREQLRTRNKHASDLNQTARHNETARRLAELARHMRSLPKPMLRRSEQHLFRDAR